VFAKIDQVVIINEKYSLLDLLKRQCPMGDIFSPIRISPCSRCAAGIR